MIAPLNDTSTLVVPMQVDALVVSQPVQNAGQSWNRWTMDYEKLNSLLEPSQPYAGEVYVPPEVGVHVHWALPDGLTRGIERPDQPGEFKYPWLPNRWLVVRQTSSVEQPTAPARLQAWVLVADARSADLSVDGAPYLDPFHAATDSQVCVPIKLGRSMSLADWERQGGEPPPDALGPFLTALGPGNVTFVAHEPGNRNVLSFLDTLDQIDKALLAYVVIGWYSRATDDPLHDLPSDKGWRAEVDGWRAAVDPATGIPDPTTQIASGLEWAVRPGSAVLPTATVVSGIVRAVNWDRNQPVPMNDQQPTDISSRVKVAVGNTATDALAALVREQAAATGAGPDHPVLVEDLLEAFLLQDLSDLDLPGGPQRLNQRIHRSAFGDRAGGRVWALVPAQRAKPADAPSEIPLSAEQNAWLAQLNATQARLDAQSEILASMQKRLADLWWKNQRLQVAGAYAVPESTHHAIDFDNARKQLPGQLDPRQGYVAAVAAQAAKVEGLRGTVDALQKNAPSDPAQQWVLKPNLAPRYHRPQDPVLLISGLGRSERFGSDGILPCRTAPQLVSGLAAQGVTLSAASLAAGTLPRLASPQLPEVVDAILAETFWLDPGNAPLIAVQGLHSSDAQAVKSVEDAIDAAQFAGTPPAAIGNRAWQQPWLPLFLEWQLEFLYTFETDEDGNFRKADGAYVFDQEHWVFDGVKYNWTGAAPTHASTFSGRTFLTPQASFSFLDRLQAYLKLHPDADLQRIEELLEKLSQWDMLSQTLTGLTAKLAMIDPGANVPPPQALQAMLGAGAREGVPYNAGEDGDERFGAGQPFFFPIRAGFLRFKNLRITDSFGRMLDLLQANANVGGNAATFKPIQGRGLTPPRQLGVDASRTWLQLEPRLVQAGRLDFDWVSADDDRVAVALAAGASPICGWLLPNHLDKSLAVYDADGNALGELLALYLGASATQLVWLPVPGKAGTSPVIDRQAPPDIANPHLRAIVAGLLGRRDGAAAFAGFLQAVDETLWTVEPLGSRSDRNLSTLIGRPLAVTRAHLQLRLAGLPLINQAFYKTFVSGTDRLLEDDGGLLQTRWPVRVGFQELRDDGVVGYFEGTDYSTFQAVHLPGDAVTSAPPYVTLIEPGNYLELPLEPTRDDADGGSVFDPSADGYLTLLVDPNGMVNVITGLLPDRVVDLPERWVRPALGRMKLTFRTGPLLLDPQAVRLPMPAEKKGVWKWIHPTGVGVDDWQRDPVAPATGTARLPEQSLVLREGWLEFTPDTKLD